MLGPWHRRTVRGTAMWRGGSRPKLPNHSRTQSAALIVDEPPLDHQRRPNRHRLQQDPGANWPCTVRLHSQPLISTAIAIHEPATQQPAAAHFCAPRANGRLMPTLSTIHSRAGTRSTEQGQPICAYCSQAPMTQPCGASREHCTLSP